MGTPFSPETPEQWDRALQRALEEGLDILVEPVSGFAYVESASRPGTLYHVSADACSCPAGARGHVCKHRAAYRAAMGLLSLPVTPAPAECFWCDGRGTVEDVLNQCYQPCDSCNGTGQRVERRLTGAPSVMPVAAAA